jgi:hypothetical protein
LQKSDVPFFGYLKLEIITQTLIVFFSKDVWEWL